MTIYRHAFTAAAAALLAFTLCMCSPSVPADYSATDKQPALYPEYDGATVPRNIAPLNFMVLDTVQASLAHAHAPGQKGIVAKGPKMKFDIDDWHELLQSCDTVIIDVYTKADGRWLRHPAISIAVAEEIDPYISYRLIEPSYIGFEEIQICQRHLESFDENEIYNNCVSSVDENGQCINCHSYQDYNRQGNMQMHVRINNGGTVIAHDGKVRKVNLKTPSTISAGVYPSWHPTLPLIAYSNNTTTQNFHSASTNKVEVQDSESDIILYDVEHNTVQIVANDSTELETFPYWSADGRWLYYVSATVPYFAEPDSMARYKAMNYRDFKYDIYRRSFDPETRTFGPVDTVFAASRYGASATHPRETRDGKVLVFTMAPYGTFHIWHKDADLYMLDLETGNVRNISEINSDDVESYHSFSSNGRWMIFSSRRDDGSYTRLYMAHYAPDGTWGKPFLLPQRDPEHNRKRFKSYNIPEFMAEPVSVTRHQLTDAIKSDPIQAELR